MSSVLVLLIIIIPLLLFKYNRRVHDPVYSCRLYKKQGCAHVDGFLCHYPQCPCLQEYLINGWENKK